MNSPEPTHDTLGVWLYGTHVADLGHGADGRSMLRWTVDARERWGAGARLLSAKLPIGDDIVSPLVRNWVDGLLPEGNARVNHALAAGVAPDDSLGLIRVYGKDTAGAAIFLSAGQEPAPTPGHYDPIGLSAVAVRLQEADRYSPTRFDGEIGESSTLPGMVPKIALHRESGQWFACKDGAPSSWILKRSFPPESEVADVIDTEVACLDLARRLRLTTVDAEVLTLETIRAIAVSRYDRRLGTSRPRVHQEDLAQAIGLDTRDPNRKFQYGAQMPSLRHAADVLRRDGGNPDALLRLVTFSVLVGNTDMHAKNISFLRHEDGRIDLAPAYDIAMHLHHPRDARRFALDTNDKYWVEEVTAHDVIAEGERWGLPAPRARRVVADLCERLDAALGEVDRSGHPGVSEQAWSVVESRTTAALDAVVDSSAKVKRPAGRSGPRRPR